MSRYQHYKKSKNSWFGEIPSDWVEWKVSRLFRKIGSGTTPKAGTPAFYENGTIPWVNTGDLNDGYLFDCENYITEKALAEHSTLKVYDIDTLLIAMYGATTGKSAILKFKACTNQACCALADSSLIDIKFAYYWFLANKQHVINLSYGGGQPNISQDVIRSLTIPIGTIDEQINIVRYLDYKTGLIADFIANRRKQIDFLYEKRGALISRAVLNGVSKYKHFNHYTNNPFIKRLPGGWILSSVRREIMMQNIEQQDGNHGELHPVAADYVDDGIPFVLASDVNHFTIDLIGCKKIPEGVAEKLRIGFCKTGDILLTHKGTIGRVGICDTKQYPFVVLTPQVTYYRIKRDFIPKYIFYQFQANVFQEQLKLMSGGGSTRDYVGIVAQRDLKLIKPPIEEQILIVEQIDQGVSKVDTLISKYESQIKLMLEYKTALLSEVLTGKADVRNWKPTYKTKKPSKEEDKRSAVANYTITNS